MSTSRDVENYSLFNLRLLLLIRTTNKMAMTAATTTATTAPMTGPRIVDVVEWESDVKMKMFPAP